MSLNYDQPSSGESILASLLANPSVNAPIRATVVNALGLQNPGAEVDVGVWLGTGPVVKPAGAEAQMMVVNLEQPAGTEVNLQLPAEEMATSKVWVFDSDADINVKFNTVERVIVMGNGNDTVTVEGDRNTTIDGGNGNDTLVLSGGADSITAGAGNDSVSAGAGDDTIVSGQGFDTINGGSGFDVIQLEGDISDWGRDVQGAVVLMGDDSGNGVTMRNVDFISFGTTVQDNGTQFSAVVTDSFNNKAAAMRLYQIVLDRSADAGGAKYWLENIEAGRVSYFDTGRYFLDSEDFKNTYGNLDNAQFVNQMYQNGFNRDAEPEGLAYWVGVLNDGANRAEVVAYIGGSDEAARLIDNVIVVSNII